ncbi:hypothetical protein CTEN210_03599 [Chaetoceros tenuissimus]|uniref:RING-type E3 ubiquitin transferase n=1 Tax=Chaetoceros tenuissimus TaxID=426638 RepID=A0AAD3CK25_9STRA|nr:hypothetical protein CTEN210_03599 [Chaetoceros tenuissimus]
MNASDQKSETCTSESGCATSADKSSSEDQSSSVESNAKSTNNEPSAVDGVAENKDVASHVKTRTFKQVFDHGSDYLNKINCYWTTKEHRCFLEGLEQYGRGHWVEIASHVGTKNKEQVSFHAIEYFGREEIKKESENTVNSSEDFSQAALDKPLLENKKLSTDSKANASATTDTHTSLKDNGKMNVGAWSTIEHCLFLEGLERYGRSWQDIASHVKTRTVEQVCKHGKNNLKKIDCYWTTKEHQLFLEGLEKYGRGCWVMIGSHVGTKSNKQVSFHAEEYFEKEEMNKKSQSTADSSEDCSQVALDKSLSEEKEPSADSNNKNSESSAGSTRDASGSQGIQMNSENSATSPGHGLSSALLKQNSPESRQNNHRGGKWSDLELEYVTTFIKYYEDGLVDVPDGSTLRQFLSHVLQCNPMRISKKLGKDGGIGNVKRKSILETSLDEDEYLERREEAGKHVKRLEHELRSQIQTTETAQRGIESYYVDVQAHGTSGFTIMHEDIEDDSNAAVMSFLQSLAPSYSDQKSKAQPASRTSESKDIEDDSKTAVMSFLQSLAPCYQKSKAQPASRTSESKGPWTYSEHYAFLDGLYTYGKDLKKIAAYVNSRNAEEVQHHFHSFQKEEPFESTLRRMLNDYTLDNIIAWLPGGRTFRIYNELTCMTVAFLLYKGDCFNFDHFQRELYTHRFEQNPYDGAWFHPHFCRNSSLELKEQAPESIVYCKTCCKETGDLMQCSGCRNVYYCSVESQKSDWRVHKWICNEGISGDDKPSGMEKRDIKTNAREWSAEDRFLEGLEQYGRSFHAKEYFQEMESKRNPQKIADRIEKDSPAAREFLNNPNRIIFTDDGSDAKRSRDREDTITTTSKKRKSMESMRQKHIEQSFVTPEKHADQEQMQNVIFSLKPFHQKTNELQNGHETTCSDSVITTDLQEISCPICLEMFNDPHIVPECCHRFCKDCIEEALEHRKECPICRSRVTSRRALRRDEVFCNLVRICKEHKVKNMAALAQIEEKNHRIQHIESRQKEELQVKNQRQSQLQEYDHKIYDLQSQLQQKNDKIQQLESRQKTDEEKLRQMVAVVSCLKKKLKEENISTSVVNASNGEEVNLIDFCFTNHS